MKKRILCFGDSNTFGYAPDGSRFPEEVRWTGRLKELLKADYQIIEEGFNGRTTIFDDPVEGGYKSALQYLPPCAMSHYPIDLVLLMLGTNDTKERFAMNAFTISQCMEQLISAIERYARDGGMNPSKILLVSPIEVGENLMDTQMAQIFGPRSIEISKGLEREYARVAEKLNVHFLSASRYAKPCYEDAIHMTGGEHEKLAAAFAKKIKELI